MRNGSPPARADSFLVGTATSTAGRPSLEEGAGRHERVQWFSNANIE